MLLLAGAALRILQIGLAAFCLGALRLADIEGAAPQVFCFVGFVFCQWNLLVGNFLILAQTVRYSGMSHAGSHPGA